MRTRLAVVALLLALAGCGHDSTPAAEPADRTAADSSGGTPGFPDCVALFKAGQPTPKAPDGNGISCSVAKGVIDAVAGTRCKDGGFLWSAHHPVVQGWGFAGDVFHAGEFDMEDPAYAAALKKCVS